mmetsp:Transcript_37892/g.65760  ORF Transcript_37892/g.65760 Transcript_37892/m.65760 type:complete len:225 (-) Transcript_37892:155-829(-)
MKLILHQRVFVIIIASILSFLFLISTLLVTIFIRRKTAAVQFNKNDPISKTSPEMLKPDVKGTLRVLAELHEQHNWVGPDEPGASDCPKGTYRGDNGGLGEATDKWDFENDMGCIPCPKGTYGASTGMTSSSCTFPCPKGTYGPRAGLTSEDECAKCPPGTFGFETGLTDPTCSGSCPSGTYSKEWGLASSAECKDCPTNYRGWQCRALWKSMNVVKTASSDGR